MNRSSKTILATLCLLLSTSSWAGSLDVPNTFSSGTPAVAADVNANFKAVKTAVDDNDGRIVINTNTLSVVGTQANTNTSNITANTTAAADNATAAAANATSIEALQTSLAALQATVDAQATAISTLSGTVTSQADSIDGLKTARDTLNATVTSQATTISSLQTEVAAVNASNVMAMESFLTVTNDSRGPLLQFSGANLQVINGLGLTATANGLGNLIVGYDEADLSGISRCSIGTDPVSDAIVTDVTSCTNAGGAWGTTGFKSGSHYLVLGAENNYSRWGGLLAGYQNTSNYDYSSVSGGVFNTASGTYSSISGGESNTANGSVSNVSGGESNTASGYHGSVSGGSYNIASGYSSNVSGGISNTAATSYSSILGGSGNTTTVSGETIP
jgi:hypothetical protein